MKIANGYGRGLFDLFHNYKQGRIMTFVIKCHTKELTLSNLRFREAAVLCCMKKKWLGC